LRDLILNIETSTEVCSVALQRGPQLIGIEESGIPLSHTRTLTLQIQTLMKSSGQNMSQLSAVSVSSGPGSYTGLRVGLSTAKGICYAGGIPLIGVSTLKGLANQVIQQAVQPYDIIIPMLDARRLEVYTTIYNSVGEDISPLKAILLDPLILREYIERGDKIAIVGPGARKFFTHFEIPQAEFVDLPVSAKNMVEESWNRYQSQQFEQLAYFEPQYLKPANVTKSKKKHF